MSAARDRLCGSSWHTLCMRGTGTGTIGSGRQIRTVHSVETLKPTSWTSSTFASTCSDTVPGRKNGNKLHEDVHVRVALITMVMVNGHSFMWPQQHRTGEATFCRSVSPTDCQRLCILRVDSWRSCFSLNGDSQRTIARAKPTLHCEVAPSCSY